PRLRRDRQHAFPVDDAADVLRRKTDGPCECRDTNRRHDRECGGFTEIVARHDQLRRRHDLFPPEHLDATTAQNAGPTPDPGPAPQQEVQADRPPRRKGLGECKAQPGRGRCRWTCAHDGWAAAWKPAMRPNVAARQMPCWPNPPAESPHAQRPGIVLPCRSTTSALVLIRMPE